ncbi:cyclase family protein [Streptomonospora wellingtoniae]|uniref:Cyclase family protein n=1 Tax=Streptomonospora wellingtoniae TaxID=3075544 RepID=A0ABU2KX96_9ACTN|nr:cyclase family protein [Streptomonospora sp. DSM 45055]MDT0303925.1 cyclase family protein [Streptomonospora sp. DSM 45055]
MTGIRSLARMIGSCSIVDLSSDVGNHAEGPFTTEVKPLEPEPGAQFFCDNVLPALAPHAVGRFTAEDFPDKAFLRHEMVTASVHAGSHVDAPGHYGPLADGGTGHINEAPLRSFIGTGLMCDVSGITGRVVGLEHIDVAARVKELESDGGVALIHTGGRKAISAEVVEAFLDAGVDVLGTDADSFDGPFQPMIDSYLESGDKSVLWPAHMLGRRRPYYQLERLHDLDKLPPSGFLVIALPVLIEGATAAWTRAVALIPDNGREQAPGRRQEER